MRKTKSLRLRNNISRKKRANKRIKLMRVNKIGQELEIFMEEKEYKKSS